MRGRYILPSFVCGCLIGEFFPPPHYSVPYILLTAIVFVLVAYFLPLVCNRFFVEPHENAGNCKFDIAPYYVRSAETCLKTACFIAALFLLGLANSQRLDAVDLQQFAESRVVASFRQAIDSSIDAFLPDIHQPLKTIPIGEPIKVSQNSRVSSASKPLERSTEHGNSNERAVLQALVLGDKSELTSEVKADFRDSGASHILALSGMHIGIIYSTLMVLLSFMNSHYILHRCKLPLALMFMLLYVLATGLSPSACRSVIMIGLTLWAGLSGRTCNRETPLLLSACILLLLDPHIARSLSFQLSFAAMGGIVFIFSTIDGILKPSFEFWLSPFNRRSWRQKLRAFLPLALYRLLQLCAVSVSCQIATMPLTLYYFGNVPRYFLITNLVASPLVTAIIYVFVMFSVLCGALNLIVPGKAVSAAVASSGGFIVYELLHLLNSLMAYIGS